MSAAVPGGRHPFLLRTADHRTPDVVGPDWTGFPVRVASCLGRARALEVLDEERNLQEDYLEWRTVRGSGRRIERVELTTELRDYWRVLAGYEPERTIELMGELTGCSVRPREVFGVDRPGELDPEQREAAFAVTCIDQPNPFNDGRLGICFMTHRSNDLQSLLELAGAATFPSFVRDPVSRRLRPATAEETIPALDGCAVAGRTSDPVLVERLARLAYEGRLVSFDAPLGVYIDGVEHARLRAPDGSPVPREWFTTSRGLSAVDAPDGRARRQRMVLEVPRSEDFHVDDLVDVATEQPILHGGQIAELVQVRVFLRTSPAGVVRSRAQLRPDSQAGRADPCRDVRRIVAAG